MSHTHEATSKAAFVPPKPPVLTPNVEDILKDKRVGHAQLPPPPANPFQPRSDVPSSNPPPKAPSPLPLIRSSEQSEVPVKSPEVVTRPSPEPPNAPEVVARTAPEQPKAMNARPQQSTEPPPVLKKNEQPAAVPTGDVESKLPAATPQPTDDRIDMSGGLVSWFAKAVSDSKILNDVAEKAKAGMETVLTTLDPGMKPYLASSEAWEFQLLGADVETVTVARSSFSRVADLVIVKSVPVPEGSLKAVKDEKVAESTCRSRIAKAIESKLVSDTSIVVATQPFLLGCSERTYACTMIVMKKGELFFHALGQPLLVPEQILARILNSSSEQEEANGEYSMNVSTAAKQLSPKESESWTSSLPPYSSPELLSLGFLSIAQRCMHA